MKKLLITGGTGFIGKNIIPGLKSKYEVKAPSRSELDLKDTDAVYEYLSREKFDIVLHSANPNPVKNHLDNPMTMFEDCIRVFMNFYRARDLCDKLIYLGSGAEFDKRRDLNLITEKEIGEYIPQDTYGLAKYIMNNLATTSKNVYNLRIFGCFGPYDDKSKFITHVINCCLEHQPITIRQNCVFDYIQVSDLISIILWFIENTPNYHDYNVCSGNPITLENIAKEVGRQMEQMPIQFLKEGYNNAYTGDNTRLLNEIKGFEFMTIQEGICKQIEWEIRERCRS